MSIVSLPIIYFTVSVFPSYVFSIGTVPKIRSTQPARIRIVEMIEIDMMFFTFIINDLYCFGKYNKKRS